MKLVGSRIAHRSPGLHEGPHGRISYIKGIDVSWPIWALGIFKFRTQFLRNPRAVEPELEDEFSRPKLFEKMKDVVTLSPTDGSVAVFVEAESQRHGELWLKRIFRKWGDLWLAANICEVYSYAEIHTDPLTSLVETGVERYRIERVANRNFDVFCELKEPEIRLQRSNWTLLLTKQV